MGKCTDTHQNPPKGACMLSVTPDGKHINNCIDTDLLTCNSMIKKGYTAVFHKDKDCKKLKFK